MTPQEAQALPIGALLRSDRDEDIFVIFTGRATLPDPAMWLMLRSDRGDWRPTEIPETRKDLKELYRIA
jgi:hypothetical protein